MQRRIVRRFYTLVEDGTPFEVMRERIAAELVASGKEYIFGGTETAALGKWN